MKHGMARRSEKLACMGQQKRSPCAGCEKDDVPGDPLAVVQDDAFNSIVSFIQGGKFGAFAQFNPERFGTLDQGRDYASAFRVARFQVQQAIPISVRVPCRKSFADQA